MLVLHSQVSTLTSQQRLGDGGCNIWWQLGPSQWVVEAVSRKGQDPFSQEKVAAATYCGTRAPESLLRVVFSSLFFPL